MEFTSRSRRLSCFLLLAVCAVVLLVPAAAAPRRLLQTCPGQDFDVPHAHLRARNNVKPLKYTEEISARPARHGYPATRSPRGPRRRSTTTTAPTPAPPARRAAATRRWCGGTARSSDAPSSSATPGTRSWRATTIRRATSWDRSRSDRRPPAITGAPGATIPAVRVHEASIPHRF
ncbi:unnamed protein product [Miscanthus lutarioriparius]|uniref:Uncharacterized protein n=1 Tax=Miscanthus lutarioriparius TaxID=422564 RepID=A0A811R761_9POAL|nr:unnamed protein product [Miscanthus lutarioriparius]